MIVTKRKKSPLTRDALRKLAGEKSYERGEAYAAGERVGEVAEDGGHVTAIVRGEMPYRVNLWFASAPVTYKCSCPVGVEGVCCKHCVALGLVWLDQYAGTGVASAKRAAKGTTGKKRSRAEQPLTMKDVRAHLSAQAAEGLVEMLMQHAMRDAALRQRLLLETAKATRTGLDLNTYRRALKTAMHFGEYVPYEEASGYFSNIDDVLSSIAELTDTHPAAVIELTEYALTLLEKAIESVDDSDGGTHDILERIHALHFAACTRARPDPEVLARTLFTREMQSEWEVFFGAVLRYAKILGPRGLATYRALAEFAWKDVPVLGAGEQMRWHDGRRFRITHIMDALAVLSGDLEARVAIKERDLSYAYSYLQIAELYESSGNRDRALHWAERGIVAFPERTDSRLRDFLVAQYRRRGRLDDAMSLLWKNFDDQRSLAHYMALHACAKRAGDWTTWRDKALNVIRASIAGRDTSRDVWHAGDGSLLVEIFLWEKDHEAAWRQAQTSKCSDSLWMQLAKLREKTHPADAISVYQRAVEERLAQKNNRGYADAVGLVRTIARVMKANNDTAGLTAYATAVRSRHKAKRNFIQLMDAAKL